MVLKSFSEQVMVALARSVSSRIGFGLFTVLGVDLEHTSLTRWYTSAPEKYRLGESWPMRQSAWQQHIFVQAKAVLCRDLVDLHAFFPDAADIEKLGLGSAISVPLAQGGRTMAVVNLLDTASRYDTPRFNDALEIVSLWFSDIEVQSSRK